MDDAHHLQLAARRLLTQKLESLRRAGVEQIGRVPLAPGSMDEPISAAREAVAAPAAAAPPHATSSVLPRSPERVMPATKRSPAAPASAMAPGVSLIGQPYPGDVPSDPAARQLLLDQESEKVRGCTLCSELACTRKQTVYGVGTPRPRVVFFGEAPGADEDRQGEPFVGRAGQLLTKIIEACGWQRSEVYIMNVLKCRPPDNRNPSPTEAANCRPYFERQFEILRPEFIVCVGTIPAQTLLETTESVGKLRGRFFPYRDSQVLVTYHPSYLLRNPAAKKYVWEDMQKLLKEMGLTVPKRSGS